MPIFRVEHNKFYTCISNAAIRDNRLSLGARGLHHLLLSNSDEWDVSVRNLAAICKEGRIAIANFIKELEEFGYLTREQSRAKGTFSKTIYNVRELPEGTTVEFINDSPVVTFPDHGTVVRFTAIGDTAVGDTVIGESSHIVITKERSNKKKEVTKEGVVNAAASPPVNASSQTRSKRKRQRRTSKEIYAELIQPERFELWWEWYKGKCKDYGGNYGDKVAAAEQWTNMFSDSDFSVDRFRKGCEAWAKNLKVNHVGEIVHGYVFLAGKKEHPSPYWESALEKVDRSKGSEFISETNTSHNSELTERILEERRAASVQVDPAELEESRRRARERVEAVKRSMKHAG